MNELIKTERDQNDEIIVSGRELHEFLEIGTEYKKWFARMLDYGFVEGADFLKVTQKCPTSLTGQNITDHHIKVDMAKELAMLQRNEKGKHARQYFIHLEKLWNSPEATMKRALQIADRNYKELEAKMLIDQPKVLFAEAVSASFDSILIGDLAKLLKQNGYDTGQNRLFKQLRDEGYLIKKKGASFNSPTQRAMNMDLFQIKETTITHSDGFVSVNTTTKVTGKGQQYFLNKYLGQRAVE
ncbi:phage antirepressor KilAC domain-containing protein [Jeotgalibacillus haloalkalitolerans]|uniref:Phage antirepressor KilAC domain-containing protein n=1 Tax=Jeotgalibacillus haloalkalitolerans TaxID=3104292 RepID=A0ABU5KLX4_9BACL|nr:phage antirepressor KilAC domain-containing protein [Jeotgalibacillus sp. HH7-29]MDZ5712272.1 phage antirepressor KilAC domain-containing protein [Jeotgalibacillus sp. HH7-29]